MTYKMKVVVRNTFIFLFLFASLQGVFRVEIPDAPSPHVFHGGKYIYLTLCSLTKVVAYQFFEVIGMSSFNSHFLLMIACSQMIVFFSFWPFYILKRVLLFTEKEMLIQYKGFQGILRQFPRHLFPFIMISVELARKNRSPALIDYILTMVFSFSYTTWIIYAYKVNGRYPYPFLYKFETPTKIYLLSFGLTTFFFFVTLGYNALIKYFIKKHRSNINTEN